MWHQLNCFVVVISMVIAAGVQQPNIVFIVADDLGWDDVSFHGSDQILTPNIDTLAYQGVVLNQYYSDSEGTASRSAMFTGKYPLRLGMQGGSLKASEDRGIPVSERLLPNFLHEFGYKTHLVGKWGIGKSRAHYLPTHRGFDTFYGFTGDSVDYLTYNAEEDVNGQSFFGLDLFENLEAVEDQSGHLTEILTDRAVQVIRNHNTTAPLYLHLSHAAPHVGGGLVNLQTPADSVKANNHIPHSARRLYAGLVSSLDKSVGHIVATLAERNILHNTVIVFVSDNGAPTLGPSQNFGSNFPFRGIKGTPWEGGVRSIGIVWHSTIVPRVSDSIFHVTDWLPTLVAAAGGNVEDKVDGVNQWFTLIDGETPKRTEALITIDDLEGWAAYRYSDFKLILGDVNGKVSGHYGNKFKQSKFKNQSVPFYDNLLLDSETARVFGEILEMYVDVDTAFSKRANFNLTQINRGSKVTTDICVPTKAKGCLFNVTADPMETIDLWNTSPDVVRRMSLQLRSLWTELKARHRPQSDPRANPSLRNYVWLPWVNNEEMTLDPPPVPPFPMQVSMRELQYLVDMNFNLLREKLNIYIGSAKEAITKSVGVLFY